jgi:hypothetical protein
MWSVLNNVVVKKINFMSQPNIEAEKAEYFEELKKKCYLDAGLVLWGCNSDGELEYVGTSDKWREAEENYQEAINNYEY